MYTFLRSCFESFAKLNSEEEWAALQEKVEFRVIKKGEFITRAGELENHVIFINKGLLRIFYVYEEKTHTARFFKEGTFTSSYESFLKREPSVHSIDALEDSELLLIKYDDLQELYNKYPIYERLGRLIAEDLFIFMCEKQRNLHQSPDEKYLDFMRKQGDLIQRVPLYIIASFMSITPETLSRTRKRMLRKKIDFDQERIAAVAS